MELAASQLLRALRGPNAAWAFYGIARLITAAPWLNPGERFVFVEAKGRAQFALNEALRRDPDLYEAAILLGQVVIAGQDRGEIRDVRERLRRYRNSSALGHASAMLYELDAWLASLTAEAQP